MREFIVRQEYVVGPVRPPAPSGDVVEVVRCKDCEFNDDGYRCPFREAGWGYDPDRYCSFGERKEADND